MSEPAILALPFQVGQAVRYGHHLGEVIEVEPSRLFRAHGWLVSVRLKSGGVVVAPATDFRRAEEE